MDVSLGGLAFFFLIAAQFFAVVAVHKTPRKIDSRDSGDEGGILPGTSCDAARNCAIQGIFQFADGPSQVRPPELPLRPDALLCAAKTGVGQGAEFAPLGLV